MVHAHFQLLAVVFKEIRFIVKQISSFAFFLEPRRHL